ncbi:MAG: hypothetical protein U0792_07765 [Gemmataceae bacterium]
MFTDPPMTKELSGLASNTRQLIYSSKPLVREATVGFDIGQGNQTSARGETAVPFTRSPPSP